MEEFGDELFLERGKKEVSLRRQRQRNQTKRSHAETNDRQDVSFDTDDFTPSLTEQSPDRFPLDLHSTVDVQPSPMIGDNVDESSFDGTESIVDLTRKDFIDSVHSGDEDDTEDELHAGVIDSPLHLYTDLTCSQFLSSFLRLVRSKNMYKSRAQSFLKLIQSIMPQPNRLPDSMGQLLRDLGIDDNLFVKRAVCTSCKTDFDSTSTVECKGCNTTGGSSRAIIYDSDTRVILSMLLTRLHRSIQAFRSTLVASFDKGSNTDLPFGRIYQRFLQQRDTRQFVNLVLHLDGECRSFGYLVISETVHIILSLSNKA